MKCQPSLDVSRVTSIPTPWTEQTPQLHHAGQILSCEKQEYLPCSRPRPDRSAQDLPSSRPQCRQALLSSARISSHRRSKKSCLPEATESHSRSALASSYGCLSGSPCLGETSTYRNTRWNFPDTCDLCPSHRRIVIHWYDPQKTSFGAASRPFGHSCCSSADGHREPRLMA